MSDVVFRNAEAVAQVVAQYREVLEQWPVPKTELRIPTRQGQTFVVASGNMAGPPVVLLHGSQANSAAWLPDIPLWASKFRLFAVDMIGEPGLSARIRPKLEGDTHALWLDDVFSGLGIGSAALVGTSLGGWLALDYASRRPDAVKALALICPAGIGRQKNFLLQVAPLLLLGRWGQRKIREKVFGPTPEAPTSEFTAMGALMDTIGRAVRPRVVSIPQLTEDALARFDIPLLAIVGGRDVLLDSWDTRARLERHVPKAEICFIEDGYHYLPDQAPRVMAFLERAIMGGGQ